MAKTKNVEDYFHLWASLSREEVDLIWSGLTSRYTQALRAGDDEKAKKYDKVRSHIQKIADKMDLKLKEVV